MNSIKAAKQAMDKFAGEPIDAEKFISGFTGATKDVEHIATSMEHDAALTVEKFNRIFGDADETAKGGE